jgi:hypothetical protein
MTHEPDTTANPATDDTDDGGALAPEPSLAARMAGASAPETAAANGPDEVPSLDRVDASASSLGREPSDVLPGEQAATSTDLDDDPGPDPVV